MEKKNLMEKIELQLNIRVIFSFAGSHWLNFGCIHIVSCQFNAMSDNNEFSIIFAEGAKLGSNDNWSAALGEMASHSKIFGMFLDVDRSGEANSIETGGVHGLE